MTLQMHRDPSSVATVFKVYAADNGECEQIDITAIDEEAAE
jgi:hypothetical protein